MTGHKHVSLSRRHFWTSESIWPSTCQRTNVLVLYFKAWFLYQVCIILLDNPAPRVVSEVQQPYDIVS